MLVAMCRSNMPAAACSRSRETDAAVIGSVLVFCPNLAVDHIIDLGVLARGEVQHATTGVLSAGGKGLNLARAGRCLGLETQVIGLVGGRIGHLLSSLLEAENLSVLSPDLARETRIATILHERGAATTTVVNEPGPVISPRDWTVMTDLVTAHLPGAGALVCTGSLLPGVPDDGYVDLIRAGRQAGVPVIIDASGPALTRCAEASPEIIKVNLEEAESAVGSNVSAGPDLMSRACRAAGRLHGLSGNAVIVTVSVGAVLVERNRTVTVPAPAVTVRNEVGAGDSFLAGLAAGLIEHSDLLDACRRAVAVASASVEAPQPGWLDVTRAAQLEQLVMPEVSRLRLRPWPGQGRSATVNRPWPARRAWRRGASRSPAGSLSSRYGVVVKSMRYNQAVISGSCFLYSSYASGVKTGRPSWMMHSPPIPRLTCETSWPISLPAGPRAVTVNLRPSRSSPSTIIVTGRSTWPRRAMELRQPSGRTSVAVA